MIGIVAAMSMEGRWIDRPGSEVRIGLSGVGVTNAAGVARRLIGEGATGLVSWGLAGGLDPALDSGTVVLADAVLTAEDRRFLPDESWRERLRSTIEGTVLIVAAPLWCSEQIIPDPVRKREVFDRAQAVAADMESAAVARAAEEAGVPWIAVRAIADTAGSPVPPVVHSAVAGDGRLNPLVVLRLIRSPSGWASVWGLWRATRAAGGALRRVWSASRPDLAFS